MIIKLIIFKKIGFGEGVKGRFTYLGYSDSTYNGTFARQIYCIYYYYRFDSLIATKERFILIAPVLTINNSIFIFMGYGRLTSTGIV